jgi:IMP cyclohydrolase
MIRGLESLAAMRYPGRGIILGRGVGGRESVVVYFITGRSPSSQARQLVWDSGTLWTRPTDEDALKKGRVDLLIYPAVIVTESGLAVSNGKQTEDLAKALTPGFEPRRALEGALRSWSFEPDAPIFTPRISGCVDRTGRASLHIVRRGPGGGNDPRAFAYSGFRKGSGVLLTTYAGPDRRVCPAFRGRPGPVRLTMSRTARETAEAVYRALRPPRGKRDFRVAVACLFFEAETGKVGQTSIINRLEREGENHGQR